jgi:hypothetical protein
MCIVTYFTGKQNLTFLGGHTEENICS